MEYRYDTQRLWNVSALFAAVDLVPDGWHGIAPSCKESGSLLCSGWIFVVSGDDASFDDGPKSGF